MRLQKLVALDVEGVLIPEVWVNLAIRTGIDDLRRTTRDEPDYDKLMANRLEILEREGVGMADLREVLAEMGPLEGARDFLDGLRSRYQVVLLSDTFEQFAADEKAIGDANNWISDGDMCQITLWNNEPLIVEPPNFVELEIVETDPGVKGDTASGGVKPAKLSTGAVVRVPLFVDQGEVIKVDTRSKEYVSRVK